MTIRPHAASHASGEDGFTIIEVMVAMVILVIGVLGTFTLLEGSVSSTSQTSARDQGTNLARDLVERSREAPYASVTMALAPATLRGMLPASDKVGALTGSTFTDTRRGVTYTVKVFACSIDDPSDGAGVGDATFCDTPTTPKAPGSTPPGPAASVNVLGIGVTAAGSLLQTVCNALGVSSILSTLTAGLSAIAPISACPSGSNSTVGYDSQPDDLRRVRVDVSWTSRGRASSVSQTTLLTNPSQT
ncbi:MAG TPA: type IV pilus modification protein PilV [Solirubrobacteraceae bacterium]|jgi:type IV pilus modification protein PilV|nr:type IV pilus modification protein PilV [Solirubrobacteraceae bacterium]